MTNHTAQGLRIALEMERRGRGLYLRAEQVVRDAKLRDLVRALAEDERLHQDIFAEMLSQLNLPETAGEEAALASSAAASFFFPGGLMEMEMEGALASREALLEAAIQGERDSIAFYERLSSHLPESERETLARIIMEEESHLRALVEQRA